MLAQPKPRFGLKGLLGYLQDGLTSTPTHYPVLVTPLCPRPRCQLQKLERRNAFFALAASNFERHHCVAFQASSPKLTLGWSTDRPIFMLSTHQMTSVNLLTRAYPQLRWGRGHC